MTTTSVDGRRVSSKIVAMTLGVPAEVKDGERRVALDPHAVALLTAAGLKVLVQCSAGEAAGFSDAEYLSAGANLVSNVDEVWGADLVVKVKEPLPSEYGQFRRGLKLFGYLHLAAAPDLAIALQDAGVEAHAFETVREGQGLPLLAPMSDIAGRSSAIMGAYYLAQGSGTLLGGSAGVPPARVAVIGMGVAGTMAARGARGMDAEVTGIDVNLERLRQLQFDGTVTATLASSPSAIGEILEQADLVIGAALVPGARAPRVVSASQVASMRKGSVIVDLAIDQGGCIETSRPTSLSDPVYEESGVIHYCVTNVPGQFPRTASRALSAAIVSRVHQLALEPTHLSLAGSLNVADGHIVHPVVAAALDESVSAS
jgi:alanine dehydrogenase